MSRRTTTEWTCARCGAVVVTEGVTQPANWSRFKFATPPESSESRDVGDLCNPCGGYAVVFITGGDVETAMAQDAIVERFLSPEVPA